jgi:hypothetical protein
MYREVSTYSDSSEKVKKKTDLKNRAFDEEGKKKLLDVDCGVLVWLIAIL